MNTTLQRASCLLASLLLAVPGCLTMKVQRGLIGSPGVGARRATASIPVTIAAARAGDVLHLELEYPGGAQRSHAWRPDGRALQVTELPPSPGDDRDARLARVVRGGPDGTAGAVLCWEGSTLSAYSDGSWAGSVDLTWPPGDCRGRGWLAVAAALLGPALVLDVATLPLQVFAALFL